MPRYILHVGPQKTGTTYLQSAFAEFRSQLKARGIEYPRLWGGAGGQYPLVERIRAGIDLKLRAEFAELNASDSDIVLMSSENFITLDDDALRSLRRRMGGAPVTVVFYCRRVSEVVRSAWQEVIKHGECMTFPDFVARYALNPLISSVVNYCFMIDRFAAIFGSENIRLVSYNHVMEADVDLFTHFCQFFLDWPDAPLPERRIVNQSLGMQDTEILRVLNSVEWRRPASERTKLHKRYVAAKATLQLDLVHDMIRKSVTALEIQENGLALRSIHDEILARYGAVLLPPCPGGRLFSTQDVMVPYFNSHYLMEPGVIRLLRLAHAKLAAMDDPA